MNSTSAAPRHLRADRRRGGHHSSGPTLRVSLLETSLENGPARESAWVLLRPGIFGELSADNPPHSNEARASGHKQDLEFRSWRDQMYKTNAKIRNNHVVKSSGLQGHCITRSALLGTLLTACGGIDEEFAEAESAVLSTSGVLIDRKSGNGINLRERNWVLRVCAQGKTRPCAYLGSAPSALDRYSGRHTELPAFGSRRGSFWTVGGLEKSAFWHYAEIYVDGFRPKFVYTQTDAWGNLRLGRVKLTPDSVGLDFDADGKGDYQCHRDVEGGQGGRNSVAMAQESGQFIGKRSGGTFCQDPSRTLRFGDFNGDGKTDYLCTGVSKHEVAISKGDGRYSAKAAFTWCNTDYAEIRIGDFDGDGRTDLQCHDTQLAPDQAILGNRIAISRGNGRFNFKKGGKWCPKGQFDLADFNADGRTDYHCHNRNNNKNWIAQSNGNGRFTTVNVDVGTDGQPRPWCDTKTNHLRFADFDGDDRADYVCFHKIYKRITVRLNTGAGTFGPARATKWCTRGPDESPNAELHFADFNGDGRTDLLCHYKASEANQIALSKGSGKFNIKPRKTSCSVEGARLSFADFNGDGKMDYQCRALHDVRNGVGLDEDVFNEIALSSGNGGFRFVMGDDPWCSKGAQFSAELN